MKIPNPANVDSAELASALRSFADLFTLIDGDRDHMNTSRLMCGQVQDATRLMVIAAAKLHPR